MLPPERILYPVDGSTLCLNISWAVRSLTVSLGARVILLDTDRLPARGNVRDHPVEKFWRNSADVAEVEWVFAEGNPAIQLLKMATPQDLIVTRWRPAGLFRNWFRADPLESVLRHAESAVCNVAHPILPRRNRRARIACAIDLCADSARIALNASILARAMNADLVLIHVLPAIDEGILVLAAGGDLPPTLRRDTALCELETFRFLPQSTRTMAVRGDIAHALRCALRETEVDLLVIGPGRQEPGELKLGLHALEIVRAAPCPVLVLDKKLPLAGDRPVRESDALRPEFVASA